MTAIVFAVTVMGCISDVRSLRLPNIYALVIIGCFIPAWLAHPQAFAPLWQHLAAMGAMFAVTYVMFCAGIMGGGDAKFVTALALWTGLKGLLPFIFVMALVGGVLGVMALALQKKKLFANPKPGSWVEQAQSGVSAVPYGIAISAGSWAAFFHTGLIFH
jgi:prepilin peptidase CpaA